MKRFISLTISILILTMLIAGCTQAPTDSSTANGSKEQSPSVANETEWPITYTDSLGNEVTIEKQPERVVSLFHAMYPDYLYSLGVYPVGVAASDNLLSQWGAYKSFTSGHPVVDIGAPNAPNLEKILELEPDIIIGYASHAELYNELAQIAPTIILDYGKINEDWTYGVKEFAAILGKQDQADEVVKATEQAVAEAANQLQDFRDKEETVMFISMTEKDIWPYTVEQLQTIYSAESGLGLKAPEGYEQVTDRSTAISLEALVQYNPDHIFLMTDYGDETAQIWLEELKSNSVWNAISAIKNGNLYLTDRSIFAFNAPIATQYGVSFVVDHLIN